VLSLGRVTVSEVAETAPDLPNLQAIDSASVLLIYPVSAEKVDGRRRVGRRHVHAGEIQVDPSR